MPPGARARARAPLPVRFATTRCLKTVPRTCAGREPAYSHYGNHGLHDAEKGLMGVSVAILFIFAVENLLLFALSPADFVRHPLQIMDFCVVVLSIFFELGGTSFAAIGGILIFARAWRFVRIGFAVRPRSAVRSMRGGVPHPPTAATTRARRQQRLPACSYARVLMVRAGDGAAQRRPQSEQHKVEESGFGIGRRFQLCGQRAEHRG